MDDINNIARMNKIIENLKKIRLLFGRLPSEHLAEFRVSNGSRHTLFGTDYLTGMAPEMGVPGTDPALHCSSLRSDRDF